MTKQHAPSETTLWSFINEEFKNVQFDYLEAMFNASISNIDRIRQSNRDKKNNNKSRNSAIFHSRMHINKKFVQTVFKAIDDLKNDDMHTWLCKYKFSR